MFVKTGVGVDTNQDWGKGKVFPLSINIIIKNKLELSLSEDLHNVDGNFSKHLLFAPQKTTNWPSTPTLYIVDWLKQCFPYHYIKGEPHGTPPPLPTPLKVKLILLKH